MEQLHGVDVSWMTRGSPRDKLFRSQSQPSPPRIPTPSQPRFISTPPVAPLQPEERRGLPNNQVSGSDQLDSKPSSGASTPRKLSRPGSMERQNSPGPPSRRNSWFSKISAKISSSFSPTQSNGPLQQQAGQTHANEQQQQQQQQQPSVQGPEPQAPPPKPVPEPSRSLSSMEPQPPKMPTVRHAVLPHVSKPEGDGPYTPAPPKTGQAGLLGVFRRLSATGGTGHGGAKLGNGLVERRTLNVDRRRTRCPITELKDAKLRRVSFCVDIEVAPMPRYAHVEAVPPSNTSHVDVTAHAPTRAVTLQLAEAGEGEACGAESSAALAATDERTSQEVAAPEPEREACRKKEKKKNEERKARKEHRRRMAEDNGSVPIEILYQSSDSSGESASGTATACGGRTASQPTAQATANPARIYRQCCQLRESPILKKITEQLMDSSNWSSVTGFVDRLDLTDYRLQLGDWVTLGDWLAVVPVREILLENSGLGDEGLRVVLAGLLVAKRPSSPRRRKARRERLPADEAGGGVVERVVLKNNKLGPDGWKHVCLFVYMCRSLKYLDMSHVSFPREAGCHSTVDSRTMPRGISDVFSRSMADRLGGSTLEMVNMGETEPSMEQLDAMMDGITRCGVRRLGLAHNQLDARGVDFVARYLAAGKCEGLDLGGNNLRPHMERLACALKDGDPLWALSLAGCNLNPASLCRMLPALVRLDSFRFIDLSHNPDLFQSVPSAVGLLRRFLPQMESLKCMHLQDVNMSSEQAIAIAEVLPEVHQLAHINLQGNAALARLADARTQEAQEEACALYASLLAAARVSESLICVDFEVPSAEAADVVKAMAKQVVAYCLRNMERIPDTSGGAATTATTAMTAMRQDGQPQAHCPDLLVHLVDQGRAWPEEARRPEEESAPDGDYVIGGTGVVKALQCCLKNRGSESGSASGTGEAAAAAAAAGGAAERPRTCRSSCWRARAQSACGCSPG